MKKCMVFLCLLILCMPMSAHADFTQQEDVWQIFDQQGQYLTSIGGAVSQDDEYIAGDNNRYRIVQIDETNKTAVAQHDGQEQMPAPQQMDQTLQASIFGGNSRKIGLYSTHSDESYVPTDGTHSNEVYGGIYDVDEQLKAELEKLGIEVVLDYTSHLPHDAGAYRRSRSTAVSLLETGPAAIFDIHRDGIAAHEYETEIEGEEASKIRLLVGKSNANADANREFAKTIKAIADEQYPGLVKDIYIGKGDYNQDLSPRCVLLEFGTHENSKELPLASTEYMAQVISLAVFGDTGPTQTQGQQGNTAAQTTANPGVQTPPSASQSSGGAGKGIAWVLGLAIGGGLLYLLVVKGKDHFGRKTARAASEMTAGLVGKKPDDSDEDPSES